LGENFNDELGADELFEAGRSRRVETNKRVRRRRRGGIDRGGRRTTAKRPRPELREKVKNGGRRGHSRPEIGELGREKMLSNGRDKREVRRQSGNPAQ